MRRRRRLKVDVDKLFFTSSTPPRCHITPCTPVTKAGVGAATGAGAGAGAGERAVAAILLSNNVVCIVIIIDLDLIAFEVDSWRLLYWRPL